MSRGTRTISELPAARCRRLDGQAASAAPEVGRQPAPLPDRTQHDGSIVRSYRFADDCETFAFVNAVAIAAQRKDHLRDLIVGRNRCEVRFGMQSVGAICGNDLVCAAESDAIFAQRYGDAAA